MHTALSKNAEIPFDDKFDFIYSYIVLQHVLDITIVDRYVSETSRLLADDGVAVLYFGRYKFLGRRFPNAFVHTIDRCIEAVLVLVGKDFFSWPDAAVNNTNIIMSESRLNKMFRSHGLEVVKKKYSRKGPDLEIGGQVGYVLRLARAN